MATSKMNEVIQHLRRTVLLRGGAGLTDGQLMEEYLSRHEEAALAVLVQRHGPMVWGVCLRTLRNNHDAEDAFQATFLVLVRKAGSVVPKEMVGNWLYGVAHQTALNARATATRRRKRERPVTDMPERPQEDRWHDLLPLLDQELSRLPDKYRVAIVLCDLEGKTRKEAAKQLGVPEGTVAGQLARARTMLAKRLARHGLEASGGALAAVLSQNAASASVPPLVVSSTIKAVTLVAAGQVGSGVISAKVVALTEGVVKAMLLTKLKIMAAVLFLLALVGSGLSVINYSLQAADPVEAKQDTQKRVAPTSDALAGLRKARFAVARKAFDKVWNQYRMGWHDEEQVYRWSVRLLEAERAAAGEKAGRVAALEGHLRRVKELEQTAPDRPIIGLPIKAGAYEKEQFRLVNVRVGPGLNYGNSVMGVEEIPRSDIAAVTAFHRAEAEVWLAETKSE